MTQQAIETTTTTDDLRRFYTALDAAHRYLELEDAQRSLMALSSEVAVSPLRYMLHEAQQRARFLLADALVDAETGQPIDESPE